MPLPQQLLRHTVLLARHNVVRALCSTPTTTPPPKVPGVKIRRDPKKGLTDNCECCADLVLIFVPIGDRTDVC